MLVGMSVWAQDWTAPSENEYQSSTPVYVQVNINGEAQLKAQVAAFIGDECRAVAYAAETTIGNSQYYSLRVWGDPSADIDKTITFKVAWNGLVFNMEKTVTWTGETHTEIPVVLNVDMPTGVYITNPLRIETKLLGTYDLSDDFSLTYSDGASSEEYYPLGESTIETELTYVWNYANSASFFTIDENNILTALQETGEAGAYLALTVSGGDQFVIGGDATVLITVPEVPVESISCSYDTWTMPITQNLYEQEELRAAITVAPDDATNPNWYFAAADDDAANVFNEKTFKFSAGGTYNIKIVSEYNPDIYTIIQVTVTVPVESISLNSPSGTFHALIGDNIYDLIAPYVEINPTDATNPGFHLDIPAEASDAITDNVAYMPGEYTIYVASDENPEIKTGAITVNVWYIQAPETLEMEVGENFNTLLEGQVSVVPQGTLFINPMEADGYAFADGMALQAGTYTLVVTCDEYSQATAEIIVTVKEPVVITYPSSLTISKLKDTELVLNITSGEENFNPDLLDIWIEGETAGVLPMPTIDEVEGSNGLKWNIRGYAVGRYYSYITYDGKLMDNDEGYAELSLALPVEIAFNPTGWDWIYSPSYINFDDPTWLDDGADNRVIEIRSQTDLLYNDETLGIFGSLYGLTPEDGMYKIKADYVNADDAVIIEINGDCYWERYPYKEIVKGYNWIGYPNEWEMTVADLNTLGNTAYDGDQIIGKTGFAEYDATSGEWIAGDGFSFQVGKGYLYYCTGENGLPNGFSFDFTPESGSAEITPPMGQNVALATQKASAESVWQYDAGQFADNMAIVAEIPQLDFPADYTVGAFVGDECRGKGSAVQGGKMMISVAGKAGERVTFRLHNELTGEFFDLDESITYSQRAGSLKNPVKLTSDAIATGIAETIALDAAVEGIFDLSGRRIEKMNVGGIYIIKTIENGKIVARKIVKK